MTSGVSTKAPGKALTRAREAVARARAELYTTARLLSDGRLLPERVALIEACRQQRVELAALERALKEADKP